MEREVTLTDEYIQELLANASAKLKAKAAAGELPKPKPKPKSQSITTNFPKLNPGQLARPYVTVKGDIASIDDSRLVDPKLRRLANQERKIEDPVAVKRSKEEKKKATAGPKWFDMPKTELTPELKRDFQMLHMRSALDPHRHYKKEGGKMKIPAFSQVGTIIEGSTEFYSGRIENKKRKRNIVEDVLAGEHETGRFKRKFHDLQKGKMKGKKGSYKTLMAKRKGGVKKGSG